MRVCSFVCCNGVCKPGLSSAKTEFEWDTSTRQGDLVRLFQIKFLQFERTWKDSPKARCSRTENLARPFTSNKVPSINSLANKYLTCQLPRYSLWRIKIDRRRFLGRLSTNLMTLAYTNSFRNQCFSFNQSDTWESKERIKSRISLLVFNLIVHEWDIKLDTRREIPYLQATM